MSTTADAPNPDNVVTHLKGQLGGADFSAWPARLAAFLAQQPGVQGPVAISNLTLPKAGGSSGTLLFSASFGAPAATQDYVLRFATPGGLFHTYDLPGQYSIMQELQDSGVAVPGLAGIDPDGAILGVTGYLMKRVIGDTVPSSYYRTGLLMDAAPEDRRAMVQNVVATLARLHQQDPNKPGFAFLWRRGAGQTALERDLAWQIDSITWGAPQELPGLLPIRDWLLAHQPPDTGLCVNHGDTMLPNYMFHDKKLVAVIDWELAFIGDPAADIANQYLSDEFLGAGLPKLEGMPNEAEWRAAYEDAAGKRLENWDFHLAASMFKLHCELLMVYRDVPDHMHESARQVREYTTAALRRRLSAIGWQES